MKSPEKRSAEEEASPAAPAVPLVAPAAKVPPASMWRLLFAAAIAVGLVVLGALALFSPSPEPIAPNVTPESPVMAPPASSSPQVRAAALRDNALRRCGAQQWERCALLLDQAVALDPAIADAPEVRAAREAIEKGRALAGDGGSLKVQPR